MTPVERLQAAIGKLETIKRHLDALEIVGTSAGYERFLHRTIDAQLQIMRTVVTAANIERNWDTLVYTEATLALADAILAGDK